MSTMNISLSESLKSFVDQQVGSRGYTSSSEYICELIREDQHRQRLHAVLLEGPTSPPEVVANASYFSQLRDRVGESGQR